MKQRPVFSILAIILVIVAIFCFTKGYDVWGMISAIVASIFAIIGKGDSPTDIHNMYP